jgi:hypothetical protein
LSRPWQTHDVTVLNTSLPWKRCMGEACPHGLRLVLVDGTHVRNTFDSDFSQGGNGFRYDFVPKNQIWIDSQIAEIEWPLIAYHECVESELMRKGWSYSRAHDRAKMLEDRLRHSASPEVLAMRTHATQLEQEAMIHQERGEDRLAAASYDRAAGLRSQLGQKKRAADLRSLAIRAIKPRYGEFVDRPPWHR